MADPAKDYYQERLVQAWSAAAVAAGYAPHHALDTSAHMQAGGYAHPSYLHQLQQNFSHLTQPPSQQTVFDASQSSKNVHRLPNGGQAAPYNYSTEQYHRPMPAHSSLPNPSRGTAAPALPVAAPMPAHMRSHPYQSSSYAHTTAPYNHYANYPYPGVHSAPSGVDKHQVAAAHPQPLNGNSNSGSAPYYQPTPDPKDFSRSSRGSSDKPDTAKNNSSQQHQQQQQQQQLSSKNSSNTPSFTPYPYETSQTPYNYHQNLYSGQPSQYTLPYPSINRPTSSSRPSSVEASKASTTKESQEPSGSNKSYQQPQRLTYDTADPVTSNRDQYKANRSSTGGNGYPGKNELASLPTTVQQQINNMYNTPYNSHLSPSSFIPQYTSPMIAPGQYQPPQQQQPVPQTKQQQQPVQQTKAQQQQPVQQTKTLQQQVVPQTNQQLYHPAQPTETPAGPSQSQLQLQQQQQLQEVISAKEAEIARTQKLKKTEAWKRKSMSKTGSSEPKQKYFKKEERPSLKPLPSSDDPYAFNDDEDDLKNLGGNNVTTSKDSAGSQEFSAKHRKEMLANPAAGPVYKFKNALLTRTTESVQQVSRRASIETWRTTAASKAAEKEKKKKSSKKDSGCVSIESSNQHADSNEHYRPQYQTPQQQQQYQSPVQQFQPQQQQTLQQIQQEILASQKLHYEAQLKQHLEQQQQQQQLQQKPHYEPYAQKVEQIQQQQQQKVEQLQQQKVEQIQQQQQKVEQIQQQQHQKVEQIQQQLQKVEQIQKPQLQKVEQIQPQPQVQHLPPKIQQQIFEQVQQLPSQKTEQLQLPLHKIEQLQQQPPQKFQPTQQQLPLQKVEQQQYQAPQMACIPPPIKTDDKFKVVNVEQTFKHETPPLNVVKNDVVPEIGSSVKTQKLEQVKDEKKVQTDCKPSTGVEKVEGLDKGASSDPGSAQPKVESDTKPPVSSGNNTKKGTLWALPIVPKLPQKPAEKRPTSLGLAALPIASVKKIEPPRNAATPTADPAATLPSSATCPSAATNSATAPLADVWRQAFGAAKPKKPADVVVVPVRAVKQEPVANEVVVKKDEKTYLDIPPEVRRRPKPTFGGLIHFSPDWERSVRTHHEQCRLPTLLTKRIQVHPKILSSSQQPLMGSSTPSTPVTSAAPATSTADAKTPVTGGNKYAASLSSYLGSPSDSEPDQSPPHSIIGPSTSDSLLNKNVVETILENRKKLRMSVAIGRMFRLPVAPEKKRYNSKGTMGAPVVQQKRIDITGLMPTPGMPIWMEGSDNEEREGALSPTPPPTNPFGNFRRQTLLRYLGSLHCSPEIKARMLDWKPEVYETKTRRQSHQVKAVTCYREIFGSEPPVKLSKKLKRKRNSSGNSSPNKKAQDDLEDSPISTKKSPSKEAPVLKKIKIMKESPSAPNKKEKEKDKLPPVTQDPIKKDVKETKRSPRKEFPDKEKSTPPSKKDSTALRETTNVSKRDRSHSGSKQKDSSSEQHTSKLKEALSRDTKKESIPEIKLEVAEAEPKKEKKKRKTKAMAEEVPSTSKTEIKIPLNPDDYQFCCAGAASGALAASALAAEAAALKALEKEKPAHKRTPKKLKQKQETANDDSESESYNPTETEENLQKELQNYALDLLEENPSWEKRKIIQNLVIWEFVPVDPSLLPPIQLANPLLTPTLMKAPPKRKGKKMRKHQSGLDFAKKKTPGKNSRCVSRATTPDVPVQEEVHDITYTLDDLIGETNRWVIDKSAGETILHRASKMGYPDAAAYALDMAKMSPTMKDNAGIPPIHKAAFRGHSEIVDYLLRFGADPNTNVKGTRPLHEALENGNLNSVYHLLCHGSDPLLYDYSGNMPIDLAEDNEEMFYYFSNILADLHGKKAERWNVRNQSDFIMPQTDDCDPPSDESADFEFEVTGRMLPTEYVFADKQGRYLLANDLKQVTSVDVSKHLGSSSKFDTIEMSTDDFLRLSHSCVLGGKPNPEIYKKDKVCLVKMDSHVRKLIEKS